MQDGLSLSIIIVNWNRGAEVAHLLQYLKGLDVPGVEIVVVDNGSTDGSAEWLGRMKSIKFVGLPSNFGPAKARNIGVVESTGKYVLFLDSDAMISRSGLARLIARMEGDPTIGIAGCRILDPGSRKLDQWIYQYPAADPRTPRVRHLLLLRRRRHRPPGCPLRCRAVLGGVVHLLRGSQPLDPGPAGRLSRDLSSARPRLSFRLRPGPPGPFVLLASPGPQQDLDLLSLL